MQPAALWRVDSSRPLVHLFPGAAPRHRSLHQFFASLSQFPNCFRAPCFISRLHRIAFFIKASVLGLTFLPVSSTPAPASHASWTTCILYYTPTHPNTSVHLITNHWDWGYSHTSVSVNMLYYSTKSCIGYG